MKIKIFQSEIVFGQAADEKEQIIKKMESEVAEFAEKYRVKPQDIVWLQSSTQVLYHGIHDGLTVLTAVVHYDNPYHPWPRDNS